uniref:L1 transposable element RRM domain-containing protein n=1 Tax=Latimeria chalumnae TaxID=7897 RepID=H3AZA7_LATCH
TIQALQSSVDNLNNKITIAETRILLTEDKNRSRDALIQHLQSRLTVAVDRIEDLENQSRQNNLRILGFPEGAERGNPSASLSKVIPKLLDLDPSSPLDIERAYCSLEPHPPPDHRPRAFIVKLLRYFTRDKILKAAWEKGRTFWQDKRISFCPDLSKDLQQKRQRFSDVHHQLLGHGMFYPATLKVTYNGVTSAYTSPEEVSTFNVIYLIVPMGPHIRT